MAGTTDEGDALAIFVGAGAFADEDEFGAGVAGAEDGLGAFFAESAAGAGFDEVDVELAQGFGGFVLSEIGGDEVGEPVGADLGGGVGLGGGYVGAGRRRPAGGFGRGCGG